MEIVAVLGSEGKVQVAAVMGQTLVWVDVLEETFEDVSVCLVV